ncbi:MAG TPA: endopeptidase, partial [Mycobacterium sp.]
MSFGSNSPIARALTRSLIGTIAGLTVLSGVCAGTALADPADEAMAKLNEL